MHETNIARANQSNTHTEIRAHPAESWSVRLSSQINTSPNTPT